MAKQGAFYHMRFLNQSERSLIEIENKFGLNDPNDFISLKVISITHDVEFTTSMCIQS